MRLRFWADPSGASSRLSFELLHDAVCVWPCLVRYICKSSYAECLRQELVIDCINAASTKVSFCRSGSNVPGVRTFVFRHELLLDSIEVSGDCTSDEHVQEG